MSATQRQRRGFPPPVAIVALGLLGAGAAPASKSVREVVAFNQRFVDAGQRLDAVAFKALVAEDAVNMLPGFAPMIGKKAIAKWIDAFMVQVPGYRLVKNEVDFHDIQTCGDWATEWGSTHQMVQPPGGGPPLDTYGTMLLVLHRQAHGEWQISREMWAGTPPPPSH